MSVNFFFFFFSPGFCFRFLFGVIFQLHLFVLDPSSCFPEYHLCDFAAMVGDCVPRQLPLHWALEDGVVSDVRTRVLLQPS